MQGKTWGADLRKSPVMLNLQFKDATPIDVFVVPWAGGHDLTGVFCTSGSEREFTLEGSWYADEEIQAGADCDVVAAG
jgi:hypothetical protein